MKTRISVLVLALFPAGSGALSAQQFEPFTRAPGVRFPAELAADAATAMPMLADLTADIRTSGEFPVLAIPALFKDSPDPAVPADTIHALLFGTEGRTVTTFYQEMSGGLLTLVGTVPDWVRTDVTVLEAAGNVEGHGWIGDAAQDHFRAALAAADPMVDFTRFDNDGPDGVPDSGDDDGYVDAVTFKFTEVAGSCGGPGFWPHRSTLRSPTGRIGVETDDMGHNGRPIRVAGYTTESVVECDGETPQGPGTMAHEFGHVLGLPDFYRAVEGIEADQRHWMIGCFGLMAAGSWGCGTESRPLGFGPTGLSPLARSILGWGTATEVADVRDTVFTLDPVQSGGRFLKVRLTDDWNEYFLIEYRPALGFDDALPAGGVLIYHVDESANIFGGAYADSYPHWLVEADGSGGLRRTLLDEGDRGVPADVFARAGAVDSLTPATTPSTALVSGEPSSVWIHSIIVRDGTARIRLTTVTALTGSPTVVPAFATALKPMEMRYRIEGGSPPYTAVSPPDGMPVAGLSIHMDGNEVVVDGAPLFGGRTIGLPLHVRDSAGDAWWISLDVIFKDASLEDDELIVPLLNPTSADADVRAYLDRSGNDNGGYDIGDLRAYLLRAGG
ncbi:MAG: M6 family metalloprotease domain-containing protein [Longimicrobiales bacterium]